MIIERFELVSNRKRVSEYYTHPRYYSHPVYRKKKWIKDPLIHPKLPWPSSTLQE
jgi:hypothetical protein